MTPFTTEKEPQLPSVAKRSPLWAAVFIHRDFVVHSEVTICYVRYIVDTASLILTMSIQSMFQNIGDRTSATPFSDAAESQCYTEAILCPGFSGNNFLQVLERHLDYGVSQCELTGTRAMAHRAVGDGRILGGGSTVDTASFAMHFSNINHRTNAVVWAMTVIEAAEVQGSLAAQLERHKTRDRVLCFRTSRREQGTINTELVAAFSSQ